MKLATMFFPLRLDKPRRNASLGLNQVDFRRKFFVIWVATKPKLTTTCVVLFRVNKKKPLKRHSNCGWWLGTVNCLAHKSACNELLDPIRKLRALDCYWYKYRIRVVVCILQLGSLLYKGNNGCYLSWKLSWVFQILRPVPAKRNLKIVSTMNSLLRSVQSEEWLLATPQKKRNPLSRFIESGTIPRSMMSISAWLFFKCNSTLPCSVGRRVTRGEWRVLGYGQRVASDGWKTAQPSKNRFNGKF